MFRHKGIRPKYKFVKQSHPSKSFTKTHKFEAYPEGGGRWWSEKDLTSGCDIYMESVSSMGNLIYCEFCDQWFDKKQFIEESEE